TRSNRRGTDPYARWCGRGGAARRPPIPIYDPGCVKTPKKRTRKGISFYQCGDFRVVLPGSRGQLRLAKKNRSKCSPCLSVLTRPRPEGEVHFIHMVAWKRTHKADQTL